MMRRRGLMMAAPLVLAAPALAQPGFPERSLRLIVPFAAGGPTDAFGRRYAQRLGAALGQPVVVENRTGAGGAIGIVEGIRARPDGYTLLFSGASSHAIYPLAVTRPQYDPLTDVINIALLGAATVSFVVKPEFADLRSFVEAARQKPGELRYGSPGTGTYLHLTAELLKREAGRLDVVHVPYRGSGPAMADLVGGHIEMAVDTIGTTLPQAQGGRVRLVAVAAKKRLSIAPDVPTVAEALGIPDIDAALWNMLSVPLGTPAPVVQRLHAATTEALADPAFQAELRAAGIEPAEPMPMSAANEYVLAEQARWRSIVQAAQVRFE